MNQVYYRPEKPRKSKRGWIIVHSEPNRQERRKRATPKKPTKPSRVYNGIKSLFHKAGITRRMMAENDLLLTVAVDKLK